MESSNASSRTPMYSRWRRVSALAGRGILGDAGTTRANPSAHLPRAGKRNAEQHRPRLLEVATFHQRKGSGQAACLRLGQRVSTAARSTRRQRGQQRSRRRSRGHIFMQ